MENKEPTDKPWTCDLLLGRKGRNPTLDWWIRRARNPQKERSGKGMKRTTDRRNRKSDPIGPLTDWFIRIPKFQNWKPLLSTIKLSVLPDNGAGQNDYLMVPIDEARNSQRWDNSGRKTFGYTRKFEVATRWQSLVSLTLRSLFPRRKKLLNRKL